MTAGNTEPSAPSKRINKYEARAAAETKEKECIHMKSQKKISLDADREKTRSDAVIELLAERGVLGDQQIDNEKLRAVRQERMRNSYHNTELLLKHYRDIAWMLECFPEQVADELDRPFESLDKMIEAMDIELAYGNRKMENRMAGIAKSRLLLDRLNEALSVLQKKPGVGKTLYDVIYLTYIGQEILSHTELLFRLGLSSRQYYRYRTQALSVLSLRLWAAPSSELGLWLDLLTVLEGGTP